MSFCKNVFEAILKYGHDEDFDPQADENFLPTDAPAVQKKRSMCFASESNWAASMA